MKEACCMSCGCMVSFPFARVLWVSQPLCDAVHFLFFMTPFSRVPHPGHQRAGCMQGNFQGLSHITGGTAAVDTLIPASLGPPQSPFWSFTGATPSLYQVPLLAAEIWHRTPFGWCTKRIRRVRRIDTPFRQNLGPLRNTTDSQIAGLGTGMSAARGGSHRERSHTEVGAYGRNHVAEQWGKMVMCLRCRSGSSPTGS